jgi:hypothetical protein
MAAFLGGGCLNDIGYVPGEVIRSGAVNAAALIRQAVAAVIALDNANRLIDNYKDQRDISRRTLAIAQQQQRQLREVFWPREQQFLAEFSNPEALETVEAMGRRYAGRLVATVAGAFAKQIKAVRCGMSRHCTSANKKVMQDILLARAGAIANARVLGRNIAFAEYQAREDTNYERRMQAVSMGRNLMGQAANLYQSAGQGLASIGNVLSGQLSSALESFGYARRDYSNSSAANDTVAQGQYEFFKSQRAGTTMPSTGGGGGWGAFTPNVGEFGYNSTIGKVFDVTASDMFEGLTVPSTASGLAERDPLTVWPSQQQEAQGNTGKTLNSGGL